MSFYVKIRHRGVKMPVHGMMSCPHETLHFHEKVRRHGRSFLVKVLRRGRSFRVKMPPPVTMLYRRGTVLDTAEILKMTVGISIAPSMAILAVAAQGSMELLCHEITSQPHTTDLLHQIIYPALLTLHQGTVFKFVSH